MLEGVSILITTFLRDGYLKECIRRIRDVHPQICIIVTDDGYRTHEKEMLALEMNNTGCTYQFMDFDSGLPAKRNLGAKLCQTEYLLMGCDDFDFGKPEAWEGILKLLSVLESHAEIDVASGRHNGNPYEGFLELVPGSHIQETLLRPDGTQPFYKVDLTVNYFMARANVVRQFPWDERMKIGGEHGDWFLTLKDANRYVVWVPCVNITEFAVPNGSHKDYSKYRGRAKELGHKIFLEKRGVKDYRGFC